MKIVLETDRLILREFENEDYSLLYELDNDPEVMKYVSSYTGKEKTTKECKASIKRMIDYYQKHPGLGIWVTDIKESKESIGWTTLKDLDNSDIIEIGYRYLKRYWGNGYATEASKALVDYGLHTLGLDRIAAVAMPDNGASRRVMEKAGLSYIGMKHYYDTDVVYYEINKKNEQ